MSDQILVDPSVHERLADIRLLFNGNVESGGIRLVVFIVRGRRSGFSPVDYKPWKTIGKAKNSTLITLRTMWPKYQKNIQVFQTHKMDGYDTEHLLLLSETDEYNYFLITTDEHRYDMLDQLHNL